VHGQQNIKKKSKNNVYM